MITLSFATNREPLFIIDYCDPRQDFSGEINASVLDGSGLGRAIEAFESFRDYTTYPVGYLGKLRAALARGQNPKEYRVVVITK